MPLATLIIPLVVKYGVPGAIEIWKIVTRQDVPDEKMWSDLLAAENASHARFSAAIKAALPA